MPKPKEPKQWKVVPEHYRYCMASGRHSFALSQSGSFNGTVIEWFSCYLCGCHRLTTRTPIGDVEHLYSRPTDYKIPSEFTFVDKREWLLYEATLNISTTNKIDLDKVLETFGGHYALYSSR
jgi:hypothetical protein